MHSSKAMFEIQIKNRVVEGLSSDKVYPYKKFNKV